MATQADTISVDLLPAKRQGDILGALFAGPILVAKLLRAEPKPIKWPDEASLFLLKHRLALEPYLFTQNRSQAIDLLTSLVLQWSNDPPEEFEIAFSNECSISKDQQIFLPIERLGLLTISRPEHLQSARKGAKYETAFTLLYSEGRYYVSISLKRSHPLPLSRITHTASHANNQQQRSSSKIKRRASFQFSNFLALFNNRVAQHYANELKISKQLSTVKFDSLSGRAVQGGLPSLGKRR